MVTGHPEALPGQVPSNPSTENVLSRGGTVVMNVDSSSPVESVKVLMVPADTYVNTVMAPVFPGPGRQITQMEESRVGHSVTSVKGGKVVISGGTFFPDATSAWDSINGLATDKFVSQIVIYDASEGTFSTKVCCQITGSQPGFMSGSNCRESLGTAVSETQCVSAGLVADYPKLITSRALHQAVELSDGRVAFLGGISPSVDTTTLELVAATEIYDPSTNTVAQGPPLMYPRAAFTATPIPNSPDKFLVVGGMGANSIQTWEIWSPFAGSTQSGALLAGRMRHTATASPSQGKIFVVGGENDTDISPGFEVFDSSTFTFYPTLYPMTGTTSRTMHTAAFVEQHGFVYLIGGFQDKDHTLMLSQVDVIQVNACTSMDCTGSFVSPPGFSLKTKRAGHISLVLDENRVLIAGGVNVSTDGDPNPIAAGEIIYERIVETNGQKKREVAFGETAPMPTGRFFHAGTFLETGHALIVGGAAPSGATYVGQVDGLLYNP